MASMAVGEDLQAYLKKQLLTVDGLECISVSDRDGVQLIEVHTEDASQDVLKPVFLGTFAIASDQASKLGVGKNNSILSLFEGHQVIQFNYLPVVLTLVATASANTGMLFLLEVDIRDSISEMQATVNVP